MTVERLTFIKEKQIWSTGALYLEGVSDMS